jgi:hypothetical protein
MFDDRTLDLDFRVGVERNGDIIKGSKLPSNLITLMLSTRYCIRIVQLICE